MSNPTPTLLGQENTLEVKAAPPNDTTPGVKVRSAAIATPHQGPSGLAQVITALAQLLHRKKRKHKRGLQHMIETRLEMPVFMIVSFTMVIRASQLFSGGTLVMSQLLGSHYFIFEIITGVGLGLGSEMLMTISGRSWKGWDEEATETEARPGMSKVARLAYVKRARTNAKWSQRVMFVGMGASLFAGLSFLFTNSGKPITLATFSDPAWWFTFISDLVATTVVTVCVFYLGVLKENRGLTDAEESLAEIDEGLDEALRAAIDRFRGGIQTQVDEKFIAEHLSPSRKTKFLRAVAKQNHGKVWTTKEIRRRLGLGNDATQIRAFNRRVNDLSKEPENALEKAPDGKTWLIPHTVVIETWGEDFIRRDAEELVRSGAIKAPELALVG